jgi:hypothetical protein
MDLDDFDEYDVPLFNNLVSDIKLALTDLRGNPLSDRRLKDVDPQIDIEHRFQARLQGEGGQLTVMATDGFVRLHYTRRDFLTKKLHNEDPLHYDEAFIAAPSEEDPSKLAFHLDTVDGRVSFAWDSPMFEVSRWSPLVRSAMEDADTKEKP